ncbi:c-type cytochrome [Gymnodinialimonas ceratoperidinii]|uniref:Cytochrome c n=1 Tax=Gymnodinialimonas ceratoperidinii TaxID=2856823 RepID=A0A8F6TYE9_9RHOB|nr:cytochrome c [Gymnodinialimonas ceratoperidinii]QXT40995.1 cytochrome c [Gymnodinialimonas ceratoperidinii]
MSKVGLGIATFVIIGVGLALANLWKNNDVTAAAGHSMEPPDLSDVADNGPIVEVALPAELTSEARLGRVAFEAVCADCHGINAAGQNGVAPPLVHITYEPNHHGDGSFLSAVRNGVQSHHWSFGNMPVIDGLTNADVRAITQYIRELQRENGIF